MKQTHGAVGELGMWWICSWLGVSSGRQAQRGCGLSALDLEMQGDIDVGGDGDSGGVGGLEAPAAHGGERGFIEAGEAGATLEGDVERAAIGADFHADDDVALLPEPARLRRILRGRIAGVARAGAGGCSAGAARVGAGGGGRCRGWGAWALGFGGDAGGAGARAGGGDRGDGLRAAGWAEARAVVARVAEGRVVWAVVRAPAAARRVEPGWAPRARRGSARSWSPVRAARCAWL